MTISVKDASGATVSTQTLSDITKGAGAVDGTTLRTHLTSEVLAALATATNQATGNGSLASILIALQSAVVTVGSIALPSGTLTRVANTTSYGSGQIVANSVTAGSCVPISLTAARVNDASGLIRRVGLKVNDVTPWLNSTVRVHLFRNSPTFAAGDGGSWAGNLTESGYIGYADVTMDRQFSDSVAGFGTPVLTGEFAFLPTAGARTIFGVLETRSAITTPGSAKVFTLSVDTYQN